MSTLAKKSLVILLALPLLLALTNGAKANVILPAADPPNNSLLFGDFNVYSLAFLNFVATGGDTSPPVGQDPFLIKTGPGQIKDDIVIGSHPVAARNNQDLSIAGMLDDAFDLPFGPSSAGFFGTVGTTDPDPSGAWDMDDTWDIKVSALRDFLVDGGSELVIYFNLNDSGTDDELAGNDMLAWALVTLWDLDNPLNNKTYILRGPEAGTGPTPTELGGGGTDIYDNINSIIAGGGVGPGDGLDDEWAYIHGRICVNTVTLAFVNLGACLVADPDTTTITQNLGADRAAFAGFNQDLSDMVLDPNSPFDKLSIDFRFGAINNGFEQIFIRLTQFEEIPEPGTLSLFGLGLLALGLRRRRRKLS